MARVYETLPVLCSQCPEELLPDERGPLCRRCCAPGNHPADQRRRNHGFKIAYRPPGKSSIWERDGKLFTAEEVDALFWALRAR